jgi:hypothetical protein
VRFRLRIWLPLLQVLLAAALITSNLLRPDPVGNPSFKAADRQLCDALNAPVVLIRGVCLRLAEREFPHLYSELYEGWTGVIIENIIYIVLVGVLWYLVSIEIGWQKEGKPSAIAEKTGIPIITDLLLICFGISLGMVSITSHAGFGTWYGVFAIPYFIWTVVIVVFYMRDLWAHQRYSRRVVKRKE